MLETDFFMPFTFRFDTLKKINLNAIKLINSGMPYVKRKLSKHIHKTK